MAGTQHNERLVSLYFLNLRTHCFDLEEEFQNGKQGIAADVSEDQFSIVRGRSSGIGPGQISAGRRVIGFEWGSLERQVKEITATAWTSRR